MEFQGVCMTDDNPQTQEQGKHVHFSGVLETVHKYEPDSDVEPEAIQNDTQSKEMTHERKTALHQHRRKNRSHSQASSRATSSLFSVAGSTSDMSDYERPQTPPNRRDDSQDISRCS